MNIVFRTDASLEIGSGHVMRCLTLANALRERGAECRFVCREHPGNLIELLREQGFEVLALPLQSETGRTGNPGEEPLPAHANWVGTDWRSDAKATGALLGEMEADWLIVDHYGLDARWESTLRPYCRKLMVIDDLADRQHDCDLFLDQNLVADMACRYDDRLPETCGRMLGPDYALLQPQYAQLHPRTPAREGPVRRVLVYFGGADKCNLTGLAVSAFLSLDRDDVAMDVVIDPSGPHNRKIGEQVAGQWNIRLHTGLPSLAPLMVKADLAIGGAGATSWERCCLGLPALVITLADNQRPIAAELDRRSLIRWLGHYDEVGEDELAQALHDVLGVGLERARRKSDQIALDGMGVARVCGFLLLSTKTRLTARLARLDDEELFVKWANDPFGNGWSFPRSTIEAEIDGTWFRQHIRDFEGHRLYIVETDEGLPIGQVHFSLCGGAWEIEYGLDPRTDSDGLPERVQITALTALRSDESGLLIFRHGDASTRNIFDAPERVGHSRAEGANPGLGIAVCSDTTSWINDAIPGLVLQWMADGHSVAWAHSAVDLPEADLCFYLSYGQIVDSATLGRFRHSLVVHASDLPKGRGWSPASWMILDGADRIPVSLIEAVEDVDAGPVYLQSWLELDGTELIDEWRALIAEATVSLSRTFVSDYPQIVVTARDQVGVPTVYPRRRAKDSRLDENKTLSEQFNQLRVADNDRYPAFFSYKGKEFVLKIFTR